MLLGTVPSICAAPLSGRPLIVAPAGSQYVRPVFALTTGSTMAMMPAGSTHGQSVVIVFAVNAASAVFSQACSSNGLPLKAASTSFVWHLRIAPTSLPTFWLAFCSHLLVALSSVSDPLSSPGHGTAAAPRAPIASARIEMAMPLVCMKGPPSPSDADAVREVKPPSRPGRSSGPAWSGVAEALRRETSETRGGPARVPPWRASWDDPDRDGPRRSATSRPAPDAAGSR